MIDIAKLFDSYSRKARLYPALLAIAPAVFLMLTIAPELGAAGWGGTIVGLAASTGVLFLAAELARSLGKRLEPQLLNEWGGWPTTLWLRHSTNYLPAATRDRYHAYFNQNVPGLNMPTAADEAADPALADDKYRSATEWLKEQCRGKSALVERENASYGFRRNMLGLKAFGAIIALSSVLAGLLYLYLLAGSPPLEEFRTVMKLGTALQFTAVIFAFFMCIFWLLLVTRSWVREGADQYARALLSFCDKAP